MKSESQSTKEEFKQDLPYVDAEWKKVAIYQRGI